MSSSASGFGFADIRKELEAWLEALVTWFPGRLGVKLRVGYYRQRLGSCGRAPIFAMGVRIASPQKLFLGNRVGIGAGAFITAEGGVKIGDCVGIGPDTKIWSVNHIFTNPDIPWRDQGWEKQEVVIEEDAWIGAASFIMPGVHIGKGAIISAGTVLAKSVPAFAIVAGNPGRVIGWRKKPETATEST